MKDGKTDCRKGRKDERLSIVHGSGSGHAARLNRKRSDGGTGGVERTMKTGMKTDRFSTVKELADKLAVTPMTIYRLVGQGKLPAVKIGRAIRFDPDAVAAFLAAVRVGRDGLKDGEDQADLTTS